MRSRSAALVAGLVCLSAVVVVLPSWLAASATAAGEPSIGVAGCETSCGGVDIPFPFGMGPGHCWLPGFEISCNDTGNGVHKPFLVTFNPDINAKEAAVQVLNISLEQGEAKVLNNISSYCYDAGTGNMVRNMLYSYDWRWSNYSFSSTANKFMVVGCRAMVYIVDIRTTAVDQFWTGCMSSCYDGKISLDPCSGMGCCQATIPKGHQYYEAVFYDYPFMNFSGMDNHGLDLYGRCSFAVLMNLSNFPSSTSSSHNNSSPEFNNITSQLDLFNSFLGGKAPLVLDWSIGQDNCTTAERNLAGYACRSINSFCFDSASGRGYICKCNRGFHGNPYLPNGCQDINECDDHENFPCHGDCTNTNGSFTCDCPPGTQGNASIAACHKDPLPVRARVATGISVGILVTLIAFLSTQVFLHKASKKRQGYFEQHGGRMLSRILETDGNNTFKLYNRGDLVKATHGFHKSNIVGEGAHGSVYKAILGAATVAVKRCKQIDKTRTDEFVQELVVLCRVNHPNIVRLLGCCLHFEAPMLVYEFVPNGTLGDLLYGRHRRRVTLPSRLRIAAETAEALAHLHKPPHPTLHGDVKPQNILLGERWVAKVSDFGCSTINDNVQVVPKGTLAYLDPEFLQDFQITEKTDVYSFGVVLIELLTGKNPQTKEWKNLTVMFQDSMGNDTLGVLLDPDIVEEASMGLIYAAAKLMNRCIAVPGKARPAMGQVAVELRRFSDQMPESPEAHVALEVEVDRDSCTASTEGGTTGSYSNFAALSTELAR